MINWRSHQPHFVTGITPLHVPCGSCRKMMGVIDIVCGECVRKDTCECWSSPDHQPFCPARGLQS